MNLRTRSYQKELLDEDNIPFSDILTTMNELNVINTFLGGHSITCRGIAWFLSRSSKDIPLVIAEIGCGGGDNLTTIKTFMGRLGRPVKLIGIDIKEECIQYAREVAGTDIDWICSDYRTVNWNGAKPDIIFSSLFCHHFTDEQMKDQLIWLKENSKIGFFINDLHRHFLAYYSIMFITSLFSKSRLVKNDAPLSVSRSFRRADWKRLLSSAGIADYVIRWQWAFRFLICYAHE